MRLRCWPRRSCGLSRSREAGRRGGSGRERRQDRPPVGGGREARAKLAVEVVPPEATVEIGARREPVEFLEDERGEVDGLQQALGGIEDAVFLQESATQGDQAIPVPDQREVDAEPDHGLVAPARLGDVGPHHHVGGVDLVLPVALGEVVAEDVVGRRIEVEQRLHGRRQRTLIVLGPPELAIQLPGLHHPRLDGEISREERAQRRNHGNALAGDAREEGRFRHGSPADLEGQREDVAPQESPQIRSDPAAPLSESRASAMAAAENAATVTTGCERARKRRTADALGPADGTAASDPGHNEACPGLSL